MRTLIIQLPLGLPGPTMTYSHVVVQAAPGSKPTPVQWSTANLLPASNRQTETVALLPAAALSWHQIDLPPGLHKQPARLQAALQGLLEDRLLDDPVQLHMALQPDWKTKSKPWVAVCDRAWLMAHLQALEKAGVTVHRIVPELPLTEGPLKLTALGDADTGWLWMNHPERGIWGQPLHGLHPQSLTLGLSADELTQAEIQAEPGLVAKTSELLGQTAQLMTPGQHWQSAIASDWDLAQFDLRANNRTRQFKTWQRGANTLWHSPAWRPARWGLYLLVISHLVGFNVWAWKTRADWQAQQQSWNLMLRENFPQIQVVVDAPVQMARELERLSQASGQLTPGDLESMMAQLGRAMPAGLNAPRQWSYQPGQLRLQDFKPGAEEQQRMQQTLATHGYLLRAEGDSWIMSITTKPGGQP